MVTGPPTSSVGGSGDFAAMVTAVTSAFGDPTRRDIYLFAREAGEGVTAAEVAARFELHPNVARHHLDKLAAGGYLHVNVGKPGNGGAGRPSKRYSTSSRDPGVDFPARNDDLLLRLLGRTLASLPPEQAMAIAEEVGEEYGRSLAAHMSPAEGQRSMQAAMRAVADALTAHGFAAHAERRGRGLAIISEQCPFGDAAVQNPVMCAVDRGMVKGMLAGLAGGDAQLETPSSRPHGDAVCVTTVA